MAVCHDKIDLVRYLLDHHLVDVNSTDMFGRTPLHYAASSGFVPIAQLLLKAGANLNQKSAAKETPLMRACLFGELEMISFLTTQPDIEFSNTDYVIANLT